MKYKVIKNDRCINKLDSFESAVAMVEKRIHCGSTADWRVEKEEVVCTEVYNMPYLGMKVY